MRVRCLVKINGVPPGGEIDLPEDKARALIRRMLAVEVEVPDEAEPPSEEE